jgi:hypothetical protein
MSDLTDTTSLSPTAPALPVSPVGPDAKDLAIATVAAAALLVFVVRNGPWLRHHFQNARQWLTEIQSSGKADEWLNLIQKVTSQYRGG